LITHLNHRTRVRARDSAFAPSPTLEITLKPSPYRVLVTGSRDWTDANIIYAALSAERSLAVQQDRKLVVVHGHARHGADALADAWARGRGLPVERHPAPWRQNGVYNPQAGLYRNRKMVDLGADACLAFIRSGSRGASHCARLADEAGIPVTYYRAD
jgi:hypothetical protein